MFRREMAAEYLYSIVSLSNASRTGNRREFLRLAEKKAASILQFKSSECGRCFETRWKSRWEKITRRDRNVRYWSKRGALRSIRARFFSRIGGTAETALIYANNYRRFPFDRANTRGDSTNPRSGFACTLVSHGREWIEATSRDRKARRKEAEEKMRVDTRAKHDGDGYRRRR